MDAKLIIVGGKANKGQVSLKLPTIVGRSREADLTIAHPMVSRQHCELFEENGLLMVRDLGSLNGTFVRKQRITEAVAVRPQEEFTVGPLTFRADYEYAGEAAAVPEPADAAASPDDMPPDFLDMDEASPAASETPSAEPVASGAEADLGPPEFDAADAASSVAEPAAAPAGQASEQAEDAAEPPPAPKDRAASAPARKKKSEKAAPAKSAKTPAVAPDDEAVSDFALGPVAARSADLDDLDLDNLDAAFPSNSAASPAADGPPTLDDDEEPEAAPRQAASQGGNRSAKPSKVSGKQGQGGAAAASANGDQGNKAEEFSEEDLDEFFKDAL